VQTGDKDEQAEQGKWVQVWKQEDPGKWSADDKDRLVQMKTVTTIHLHKHVLWFLYFCFFSKFKNIIDSCFM